VQAVIGASKSGDWSVADSGLVTCGGVDLVEGEYALETVVGGEGAEHLAVAVLAGGGFVALDLSISAELEAEGWARDVIRQVQDERKAAGLHVADRISLTLTVPADRAQAGATWREVIAGETLADTVTVIEGDALSVTVSRS
jgi:isoleucyl-tRNA synthetase